MYGVLIKYVTVIPIVETMTALPDSPILPAPAPQCLQPFSCCHIWLGVGLVSVHPGLLKTHSERMVPEQYGADCQFLII